MKFEISKVQLGLFLLLGGCVSLNAQVFELAAGAVNSTLSDSRGVNFLDLNNDGWEDVFISNGLQGGQKDLLYINDGNGLLKAVTDMDIVTAVNPADGASFADYNNDGHIDGVVSSWYGAEDLLYLNDGTGNLKYNANAGIVPGSFAEAAAFGDYDGDGLLDLYITNSAGNKINYLYRNLGTGKFEQITDHILVGEAKPSRGAVWGDFDNNGITDLYVANESSSLNDLYLGTGGGAFEKFNRGSIVTKSNGTLTGSWGDIDNDGDFDLFVGNSGFFAGENNQLIRNFIGSFGEIPETPIRETSNCTFGSAFGDYDNDGDLDLIITNGFCNTNMFNVLYENQGDGTFVDVSQHLIANTNSCSYGAAWGDVNNDGFLDLLIANCKNNEADTEKRNTLLMNLGNDNNWLEFKLEGIQSNASAIGAKIRVKANINGKEVWQIREIRSQSGYAGQNSLIAHFGLADATKADSVIILWPAGSVQVLENLGANKKRTIQEGVINSVKRENQLLGVSLQLYPNPLNLDTDTLQLKIDSPSNFGRGQVELYNAQGQLVWKQPVDVKTGENSLNVDLSTYRLPGGLYHLNLSASGGQVGKKVIFK